MSPLLELFEMAAVNRDALTDVERADILEAQLALEIFARAMLAFQQRAVKTVAAA